MNTAVAVAGFSIGRFVLLSWLSEGGHVPRVRDMDQKALQVYDVIKDIRDPERPNSLEDLNVVSEECVCIHTLSMDEFLVIIRFTPTIPHCSLATLIGLCLRVKLERSLPFKHKLEIYIAEGTHVTEKEINKQINDKERIAAAMENSSLREIVESCIKERDD